MIFEKLLPSFTNLQNTELTKHSIAKVSNNFWHVSSKISSQCIFNLASIIIQARSIDSCL